MFKKNYVKSRKVTKVTFEVPMKELPADVEIKKMNLVGDFNKWSKKATPMEPNKAGVYKATLELEPGREYQFRYLINGKVWCNDWNADGYITNEFGEDNCIVTTPNNVKA